MIRAIVKEAIMDRVLIMKQWGKCPLLKRQAKIVFLKSNTVSVAKHDKENGEY